MSFFTEISSLKDQLQISKSLHNTSVVIEEYSLIYGALGGQERSVYFSLVNAITRFKVLKVSEIISNYEQVISLLQKANDAFIIFNNSWSEKKHQSRQDDNVLNDCVKHIDNLIIQLNQLNNECWQQWLKSLEDMRYVDPIALKSLKNIPNQVGIYDDFIRIMAELKNSTRVIPTDLMNIEAIKQKNDQLISLKNKMDFDFDQEIKDFFDDLSVVGSNQVALSKYTEKVAAYLEVNNSLGQYVIKRLGS
jgi:hypothetical protein